MKKRLCFLAVLLLALLFAFGAPADGANLVLNGGFEEVDEFGDPEKWYESMYHDEPGYSRLSITDETAHTGNYSAMVENASMNDARYITSVSVKPNSYYRLSGYVLVESMGEEGNGANFGLEDMAGCSMTLFDTAGEWQYLEWYGKTGPKQKELTFGVRVGGFSAESIGKAYFDDISLEEVEPEDIPDEVVPSLWYKLASVTSSNKTEKSEKMTGTFVVVAVLFAILIYLLSGKTGSAPGEKNLLYYAGFALILLLGIFIRLYLGMKVPGYQVDIGCFTAWAGRMLDGGPANFYQKGYFCDYPPGYMLLLWPVGLLMRYSQSDAVSLLCVKLMPILFDIAAICLLFFLAKKKLGGTVALILAFICAVNPALLVTGAAWGQADSVLAFILLLCCIFAVKRQWHIAIPLYVLSVLVKPQALLFGPLLLVWLLLRLILKEERTPGEWKRALIGVGLSFVVAALVLVPFAIHMEDPIGWIFGLYGDTLTSYPYATLNTANLYYLIGANWKPLTAQPPLWLLAAVIVCALAGSAALAINCSKKQRLSHKTREGQICLLLVLMAAFVLVLAGIGCDYAFFGFGMMGFVYLFVMILVFHDKSLHKLPFYLALLLLMLYMLAVKIHERYLFPALLFLLLSFVYTKDRRMLRLFGGFSATSFVNIAIILENSIRYGSAQGHLNNDTYVVNILLCIANLLLMGYGIYIALTAPREEKKQEPKKEFHVPEAYHNMLLKPRDARLHLDWKDAVIMAAVTAVYAVLAFANLGSTVAPQNGWISSSPEETVTFQLEEKTDFYLMYYCGVSKNNFSVSVSDDGENWSDPYPCEMRQGLCYRWNYAIQSYQTEDGSTAFGDNSPIGRQRFTGKYLRINAELSGLNIFEIAVRNEAGEQLPLKLIASENANPSIMDHYVSPEALIDEQNTLVGEPGWYTGTYFDEIYHARTAYEHLHGQPPYETTHPPLGKLLMALGVAIFGMTPFGWRFAGTFIGVLMLPALYILAKQLFHRRDLAIVSMGAFALDLMHYTQTRIATIDSFPVFFILLSYIFMCRYVETDVFAVEDGEEQRLFSKAFVKSLIPLFFSGLFMGLSIASKWIGMYSAVGLAILFFTAVIRQYRASDMAFAYQTDKPEESQRLESAKRFTLNRIFITCGFCLVFFIAIPALIYYLSYIPYLAPTGKVTIERIIQCQIGMYNYHATPGLGMDHPFHSTWYEWPFILKPMWFAQDKFEPQGMASTIMCMGNPWVFYIAAPCMVAAIAAWLVKYIRVKGGEITLREGDGNLTLFMLVVAFAAQYLPWVLVPRGTYIYHYFASVPFVILATAWCIGLIPEKLRRIRWIVIGVYLVGAAVFFALFFPFASGWLTDTGWFAAVQPMLSGLYY